MDININMVSLAGDIETSTDILGEIKSDMNAMFTAMEELDSMWNGAASEEFKKQIALDKDFFDSVCKNAQEFIDHMQTSNGIYHKCEDNVLSKVNSIPLAI